MPRFYVATNGKRKRKGPWACSELVVAIHKTSAPLPKPTKARKTSFCRKTRKRQASSIWATFSLLAGCSLETDKAPRESLLTGEPECICSCSERKLLIVHQLLGLVVLLATVICDVMLALESSPTVASSDLQHGTYVGYTSAGLAGRRESWPGSSGTCGYHHTPA